MSTTNPSIILTRVPMRSDSASSAPVSDAFNNLPKDCSNYIGGNPLVTGEVNPVDNWQIQVNDRKVARAQIKRKEQLASLSSIQINYQLVNGRVEVTLPKPSRGCSTEVKRLVKKRQSIAYVEHLEAQRIRQLIEAQALKAVEDGNK